MPALRRKLMLINAGLVAGLAVVGGALTWGIRSLRDDVTSAASEYAELRLIEEAMDHASQARANLDDDSRDLAGAAGHVEIALQKLQSFVSYQKTEEAATDEHQRREMREETLAKQALTALQGQIRHMREGSGTVDDGAAERLAEAASMALSRMALQTDIAEARASATERTVTTLIILGVLALLLVLGSVIATIICYRSVMVPLRRLQTGVRRVASGEFSQRLPADPGREFAELAADFNHMAGELQTLYRDLEEQVRQKSRELVKSERLASVGYLAAGVAHEINNPLSIMSGYAELAGQWAKDPSPHNVAEIRSALEIIRAEAFRCKGITERLLSLTRMGEGARGEVSIVSLATEVADMLRGLHKYQDRRLMLRFENAESLVVKGNPQELKQVLLNLLVNALEAVPAGSGEVNLLGSRSNGCVCLSVKDNGVGMTREILERAFEPFFTARPNLEVRGTGLGLAISHSIIESHGGILRAESEGPGRGSCFTIELPALEHLPSAN